MVKWSSPPKRVLPAPSVKYTALDALLLGFKTVLLIDGCKGVNLNAGDVERAVDEMREAGVEIVDSEQIANNA